MSEAVVFSCSRSSLEDPESLNRSEGWLLTEPADQSHDITLLVYISPTFSSKITAAAVVDVELSQQHHERHFQPPVKQPQNDATGSINEDPRVSGDVDIPLRSAVSKRAPPRQLMKLTSVIEPKVSRPPLPATTGSRPPRPTAIRHFELQTKPRAPRPVRQFSSPATFEDHVPSRAEDVVMSGAAEAPAPPCFCEPEPRSPSKWALIQGRKQINLLQLTDSVFSVTIPLPCKSLSVPVWEVVSGNDPSFIGLGTLSFRIHLQDGMTSTLSFTDTLEVDVDSHFAGSRVIFGFISPISHESYVRIKSDSPFQTPLVPYTAVLEALWALYSNHSRTTTSIDTVVSYRIIWLHGLLLACMHRVGYYYAPLSCNLTLHGIARLLQSRAAELVNPTAQETLLVWTFVGQAIHMAQFLDPETLSAPDGIWDFMLSSLDLSTLKVWFQASTTAESWGQGKEHLKYFFKAGLSLLCTNDRVGTFSTFRFVRGAILLSALHIQQDASSSIARAPFDLQLPKTLKDVTTACQNVLSKPIDHENNAHLNVFQRVLDFAQSFSRTSSSIIETQLQELPALESIILSHFNHPLHEVSAQVSEFLRRAIDQASSSHQLLQSVLQTSPRLHGAIETARQKDLFFLQSRQMKNVMNQFSLEHSKLRLPVEQHPKEKGVISPNSQSEATVSTVGPTSQQESQTNLSQEPQTSSPMPTFAKFQVATFAGTPNAKGFADADNLACSFNGLTDIAEYKDASYLVLERNNSSLRLIDNNMKVTTLIGRLGAGHSDRRINNARLQRPRGLFVCQDLSILIADAGNHCIRRIDKDLSKITTIAGIPETPGNSDGSLKQATLRFPSAVCQLPNNDILISDQFNHTLRLIKNDQLITVAGTGKQGYLDGPATQAQLNSPAGLCMITPTRVAFTDSGNHVVRCFDLETMMVSTLAGIPGQLGYIDGLTNTAMFSSPSGICMGLQRTLVIADSGNHCIRAILPSGEVVTLAGQKESGHHDGMGSKALFVTPLGVHLGSDGSILVVDSSSHVVRRLLSESFSQSAFDEYADVIQTVEESVQDVLDLMQCVKQQLLEACAAADDSRTQLNASISEAHRLLYRREIASVLELFSQQVRGMPSATASTGRVLPNHNIALELSSAFIHPDVFRGLILTVPRVADLVFLLSVPLSQELTLIAREAVLTVLRRYKFSPDRTTTDEDLAALETLEEIHGTDLIDQETALLVFRAPSFTQELGLLNVSFLHRMISRLKWSLHRLTSGVLRRGLAHWLSKLFKFSDPDLIPFNIVLQDTLQFWALSAARVVSEWQASKAPNISLEQVERTLLWCMHVHWEEFLFGKHAKRGFASLAFTLRFTQTLADSSSIILLLQTGFVNVLQGLIESTPPQEVIYGLLASEQSIAEQVAIVTKRQALVDDELRVFEAEERRKIPPLMSFEEQAGIAATHRNNLHSLLFSTLKSWVNGYVAKQLESVPESRRERVNFHSILAEMQIDSLIRLDLNAWCRFIVWFAREGCILGDSSVKMAPGLKEVSQELPHWKPLEMYGTLAANIFTRFASDLTVGAVSVDLLSKCGSFRAELQEVWLVLHLEDTDEALQTKMKFVNNMFVKMAELKEVASCFLGESVVSQTLLLTEQQWKSLTVIRISEIMNGVGSATPLSQAQAIAKQIIPLPSHFLASFAWLQRLVSSRSFQHYWESELARNDDLERLLPVSAKWRHLWDSLESKNTEFRELAVVASFLVEASEWQSFAATAPGFSASSSSDVAPVWRLVDPESTNVTVVSVQKQLSDWLHLQSLRQNIDDVLVSANALRAFIEPSGQQHANDILHILTRLVGKFSEVDWNCLPLSSLSDFLPMSSQIDPRLVKFSGSLAVQLKESIELFDWLRETPGDSDFTSAIEVAMSRSEMECPPELWEEAEGRIGRPDEQKLSQLSTVRSYFRDIIFRTSELALDINDLFNAFGDPQFYRDSTTLQHALSCLATCNELRLPLMELMAEENENSAPDRLLQLQLPQRQAVFTIQFASTQMGRSTNPESKGLEFLALEYVIPRRTRTIHKKFNLSELVDFQSLVVLSKTKKESDTQQAIDKFIQQFAWTQKLAQTLWQLRQAGHFEYTTQYSARISLSEDPDMIKKEAIRTEGILYEWLSHVEHIRRTYYSVNFFSLQQLATLVNRLEMEKAAESHTMQSPVTLGDFLYFLNSEVASQESEKMAFETGLRGMWKAFALDETCRSAFHRLEAVATCLEAVCCAVQPRRRLLTLPEFEGTDAVGVVSQKVINVICAESSSQTLDHILSEYARFGLLPERESFILCTATTTWEDLFRFVLRWAHAHKHQRANNLYCLGFVERLTFDLQRRITLAIRDLAIHAKAPLLIAASVSENQHIVAHFSSCRIIPTPLSARSCAMIGSTISQTCQGVTLHTSSHAGAGKTFAIRTLSHQKGAIHVPVHVHSSLAADALIRRIHGQLIECDAYRRPHLLHFDITDPVREDFNTPLFEIIVFGSLVSGTECWLCDSKLVSIAVEVAAGALIERLRICRFLEVREAIVTGSSFVASREALMIGMGDGFLSTRNDGTSRELGQRVANAYQRLQFVSTALWHVSRGDFPFDFKGPATCALEGQLDVSSSTNSEDNVDAAECLSLLLKYSELRLNPSLWCVWNYINVMYWQLREMHHPESPINCACMPDISAASASSRDLESKQKIKCEIVAFMSRTAREFATRQVRRTNEGEIAACHLQDFSRPDFNGLWKRMSFDNDGFPCFQSSQFYLYYRSAEARWVIDDVIEASGGSYAASQTPDLNGPWLTLQDWEVNQSIRVRLIKDVNGYMNSAVQVSGCREIPGASVGADENGIYLRQPPLDDIEGRPHYIKRLPIRRHLFWKPSEKAWQISPVCNDDEGAFALSQTVDLEGNWKSIPARHVERGHKITMLTAAELHRREHPAIRRAQATSTARQEVDQESILDLESLQESLLKWNDSNHESLLFSNENHVVFFLSLDPKKLREKMHPGLLRHLQQNNINVGADLDQLGSQYEQILGSLTDVRHSKGDAAQILGGRYCLTGDSLMKMLAIYVRVRCGIPVILMGECGCGKTELIRYLCAWLKVDLLVLDVHGGTSEADIMRIFEKAEALLRAGKTSRVFVFLDEVNTCAHMGLFTEVIVRRSIHGRPLMDGIQVLAALNPYRLRKDRGTDAPGLVYQLHGAAATPDPMRALVYRVHPVPATLQGFIFDFGSLTPDKEQMYIASMAKNVLNGGMVDEMNFVAELIFHAQQHVREEEGDSSATSLRDVRRCLNLVNWFLKNLTSKKEPTIAPLAVATVMAIAFTYYYRLASQTAREGLFIVLRRRPDWRAKGLRGKNWDKLAASGVMENILASVQRKFCENVIVEEGIAMNNALMENLFVVIVCILNKIPIFLVGKPGSSKTLTLQVIASNLQGMASANPFWRKFPAVYLFQYQCSPMSSSHSIQHQFDMARSYQEHAQNVITVLLLDEVIALYSHNRSNSAVINLIIHSLKLGCQCNWAVSLHSAFSFQRKRNAKFIRLSTPKRIVISEASGIIPVGLAEHSPDMPLKVLHGMLVDPPIAIVGLSNWVLDPAKMNRAICLQRTEPTESDIQLTGQRIVDAVQTNQSLASRILSPWLGKLAQAYHTIYMEQSNRGRDFFGMRDYYSLIKLLRIKLNSRSFKAVSDSSPDLFDPGLLIRAVCRNFGGSSSLTPYALDKFYEDCFGHTGDSIEPPPVRDLIKENLRDYSARHLMVITTNGSALPILLGCKLLNPLKTTVLIGSEFKEDISELHLVQQINEVKLAMASGSTVVLLNHDNIYEALYDVLNQRYVFKTDTKTGRTRKMLRLAIGARSQLCNVDPAFKIVVIVEADHAYNDLDLPLLNRFEKQILTAENVLGSNQLAIQRQLENWAKQIAEETELTYMHEIFCGFEPSCTISSVVLALSNYNDNHTKITSPDFLEDCKRCLAQISLPLAFMHSISLQSVSSLDYVRDHANLLTALSRYVTGQVESTNDRAKHKIATQFTVLLTHSPVSHLDSSMTSVVARHPQVSYTMIQLAELSSERQLVTTVSTFLTQQRTATTEMLLPTGAVRNDHSIPDTPCELLVVQCDPIACRPSLINHARFICVQQDAFVKEDLCNRRHVSATQKVIMFVIHLPPGVRQRKRWFGLDFRTPWTYLFVDDLRPETGSGEFSMLHMMQSSPFTLAGQGAVNIRNILLTKYQSALCACGIPALDNTSEEDVASVSSRIRMLFNLQKSEKFVAYIENAVLTILEAHQELDRAGMHAHVAIIREGGLTGSLGGTMQQSLQMALEMVVVQAFSAVIRALDRDFNLCLLATAEECVVSEIWFALANISSIVDMEAVARQVAFSAVPLPANQTLIANSSRHGVLFAKFPFSHRIIKLLEAPETRNVVRGENVTVEYLQTKTDKIAQSLLGVYAYALVTEAADVGRKYLHDYVHCTTNRYPGLSFADLLLVHEIIVGLTRSDSMSTPGRIHAACWFNERRLLRICALLSSHAAAHRELVFRILSELQALLRPVSENDNEPIQIQARLAKVDVVLLSVICQHYSSSIENLVEILATRQNRLAEQLKEKRASKPTATASRPAGKNTPAISTSMAQYLEETDDDFEDLVGDWLVEWREWLDSLSTVAPEMETALVELDSLDDQQLECVGLTAVDNLWQQWYMLRVLKLFIQEFMLPCKRADRLITATELTNLLQITKTLHVENTTSFEHLANFVISRTALNARSKDMFISLYLQDIVFGAQKGFPVPRKLLHIEDGFFELLLLLLETKAPSLSVAQRRGVRSTTAAVADPQDSSPVPKLTNWSLGLESRAILLQLLLNTPGLVSKHILSQISNIDVQRLYMRICVSDKKITSFTPVETDLALLTEEPEIIRLSTNRVEYLHRTVIVQGALRRYAQNILAYLETPTVDTEAALKLGSGTVLAPLLSQHQRARAYVLKQLRTAAGADVLEHIVHVPHNLLPWLHLDRSALASNPQVVINPLPWITTDRALYDRVSSAIRLFVAGNGDLKELKDLCLDYKIQVRPGTLICALASQTALVWDSIYVGRLVPLKEFLRSLFFEHRGAWHRAWPMVEWILAGCPCVGEVPKSRAEILRTQLVIHVIATALNGASSGFFTELIFDPLNMASRFFPTMPDNEFAALVASSGHVGWYKCPNGHPYSVGNCTYPMQLARCIHPGCNAQIGGQNHVPTRGNTRLQGDDLRGDVARGYITSATSGDNYIMYGPDRSSVLCTSAIRMLLHAIMLTGTNPQFRSSHLARLVSPSGHIDAAQEALTSRLESDWQYFMRSSGLSLEDSALILHLVISQMGESINLPPLTDWINVRARGVFELAFQSRLDSLMDGLMQTRLVSARESIEGDGRASMLKATFGIQLWDAIHEKTASPTTADYLWQLHTPITFETFEQRFSMHSGNAKEYPLLAAFLKEERRLPMVKYIADILAWHRVLFDVLGSEAISRQQSSSITNSDVLLRVPVNNRVAAQQILESYCVAFNTSFPLVTHLYECQENPFLTKDGRVDLSGTKTGAVGMCESSPVSFSLPSMIQGETDAQGLCTIQLLDTLRQCHCEVLDSLTKSLIGKHSHSSASSSHRRVTRRLADREEQVVDDTGAADPAIAPTSYLTAPSILQRQLIVYDREKHLMPLLRTYVDQCLDYGQGGIVSFDFKRIEDSIASSLLAGKRPILLSIRHFEYAGELQTAGRMSALALRIPQDSLLDSMLENIWNEIDTQDRLTALMVLLEDCINFLVAIGGSAVKKIDGTYKLESYILETMLVDPRIWCQTTTPTISQAIELRHLRDLVQSLEAKMHGDPLERVELKYRKPLPEALLAELKESLPLLDVAILLPELRNFLLDQLTKPTWASESNLKQYLAFSTAVELEDMEWYQAHFPEALTLQHALSCYQLLAELAGQT